MDAPHRSLPRHIAAGFFACAAPDLDFVVAFVGPVEYLENHRGVTHSLVLLPLWAFVVSWVLAKILREPRGARALYGVTALGLALHIAGDVITSYGTMILAPLSDWRAQIGTTFIVDLWFSGIIAAGLAASAVLRRSRWPAVAATALLVAYVGFQYLQKEKAVEFGERYAPSLGLGGAAVNVQPRPVSPFNWTVFVSGAEAHRFAHVNLIREEPRGYRPGHGFRVAGARALRGSREGAGLPREGNTDDRAVSARRRDRHRRSHDGQQALGERQMDPRRGEQTGRWRKSGRRAGGQVSRGRLHPGCRANEQPRDQPGTLREAVL